jgi:hypothetical protein
MSTTLDRILTDAEALPEEEQAMLAELLRGRQIETWRRETAAEAKKAIRAFKAGKAKSQSVDDVISRLRAGKERE